jgi:hypothetical protein
LRVEHFRIKEFVGKMLGEFRTEGFEEGFRVFTQALILRCSKSVSTGTQYGDLR